MALQLYLDKRKLYPIGNMSVADRHASHEDNIHWDLLALWGFPLNELCSSSSNLPGYTKPLNLTASSSDKKSPLRSMYGHYPQPTMRDPLKWWQDSHLLSLLITHGTATVHRVALDWGWGACPKSLEASLVSPKPATGHHTTTRRTKYARRWFPHSIQVAHQKAVTLTPLIYPANRFQSDWQPQLIWYCGGVSIDLTSLGSTQLHSHTVLSCSTKAGARGRC